MFDRLVCWAIFTQTNRVMGVDHDLTHFHQRGHTDRVAGVIREHHERSGVGNKAAGQRNAIGDRGHTEFAHTVKQIVAAVVGGHALGALPPGQIGTGQIGRAAQQFRQVRRQRFDGQLRGFTRGNGLGFGLCGGDEILRGLGPVSRQLARDATGEFCRFSGECFGVSGESVVPGGFTFGAGRASIPGGVYISRDFKGGVRPANRGTCRGDFISTQRRAMHVGAVGFVR